MSIPVNADVEPLLKADAMSPSSEWRLLRRAFAPLFVAGLLLLLIRMAAPSLTMIDGPILLGLVVIPTAVVGVLAGAIWFGRQSQRAFLWLALCCLCISLYSLPRVVPLPVAETWVIAASLIMLSTYISASAMLGLDLFDHAVPGLHGVLCVSTALVTVSTVVMAFGWPEMMLRASAIIYAGLMIYGFTVGVVVYIVEHLRRPTTLSFVMQICAHCMGAAILWESSMLAGGTIWTTPSWFLLMAPLTAAVVTFWLLQRFGQALGDAQRWTETLELQVAERELEIAESYERLRRAEHESAIAQERERLFRDMHDGLGGTLVLTLSRLLNAGAENTPVARALQSALNDLRLILSSLTPGRILLRGALADLHARLVGLAEDEDVQLHLHIDSCVDVLEFPPSVTLQVLRIVQEACINSLRHANARQIQVAVTMTEENPDQLIIHVDDDGCGFEPAGVMKPGHVGLINQLQRAQQIGARLGFEKRESGMRMTLLLPLH